MRFNVHDWLQGLTLDKIKDTQKKETLPYAVAALNVQGDLNLSNMIRSAVVFGAEKFYIIGKQRFDRRGCVGAQNYIEFVQLSEDTALEFLMENYMPALIEQGGSDLACANFYGWRKKPCLIFGSESRGLPETYLKTAAEKYLPTYSIDQIGVIRSLNVGSAAAIAMWKVAMDLRVVPRSTL
jgi:tRNA G18 (ribose-2'-O)-methylase SpoU